MRGGAVSLEMGRYVVSISNFINRDITRSVSMDFVCTAFNYRPNGELERAAGDMHALVFNTDYMSTHLFRHKLNGVVIFRLIYYITEFGDTSRRRYGGYHLHWVRTYKEIETG